MNKFKAHFLTEANKDAARGLTHPTLFNVAASLLCVVLLVAWGGWVWHVGLGAWESGQATYRAANVTAAGSPIRYALVLLGSLFLGAFSFDAAIQYAVEAVCRVRRMLNSRANPDNRAGGAK